MAPGPSDAGRAPGEAGHEDDGAGPGGPLVVVIGRYSADRDLQDQIMARLVSGESPTAVIELVPGFGRWRHHLDHYAVVFTDERARPVGGRHRRWLVELVHLDDPRLALGPGRPASPGGPGGARRPARGAGPGRGRPRPRTRAGCMPVDDPMRDEAAVILVWGREDGPDLDVHALRHRHHGPGPGRRPALAPPGDRPASRRPGATR